MTAVARAAEGYLGCLQEWAKGRGLEIRTIEATQREPDYFVAVVRAGPIKTALISRTSQDSLDTAAFYLANTLELLGVEVPPFAESESA